MAAHSIAVAARSSALSRAQVREVEWLLQHVNPLITLQPIWLEAYGDLDPLTSLRDLPPSDFFTREIDGLVQCGEARLAVHSAKDLPPTLPDGLLLAGLTPCLDARDSLVLREGLLDLPTGAIVATSSTRRDEQVRQRYPEVQIVDLRGPIHERLERLKRDCDAVVVAECALMRLGLCHLPRIFLEGPTAEHQGQLALVCRRQDHQILLLIEQALQAQSSVQSLFAISSP